MEEKGFFKVGDFVELKRNTESRGSTDIIIKKGTIGTVIESVSGFTTVNFNVNGEDRVVSVRNDFLALSIK